MKKISIYMAVFFVSSVWVLPGAAVTWGEPDAEHTNVGAMVTDPPQFPPFPAWCSGILIHPCVFLTAGHCTAAEEFEANGITTVWVTFDQETSNHDTLLAVEEVITHPDYDWGPQSNPHDVGVLILEEPVPDEIPPAVLPPYVGFLDYKHDNKQLKHGTDKAKFTVVGYGDTLSWPPPDLSPNYERQYAVSEFRALLKAWLRLSQNQATGDGGACYGDSGGPAFWTESDGTKILVGLNSWGDVNCVTSGFYYRVDIPETLDFIKDVISRVDVTGNGYCKIDD
jgi:secreted trypsin-like serine protease